MPVYIKKYRGNNYFQNRTFIDAITLDWLPEDGFPIFRFETEDFSTVGTYRGGDFDITISLLDNTKSQAGNTLKDFFLGAERDFFYLVIVVIGSQTYSGIAQQSQISGDFTFSEKKYEIKPVCKDMLMEWAKRCGQAAISTINFPNFQFATFENYIYKHFAGLTSDVLLIGLPTQSYLSRLLPYGNPAQCMAFGDFFNFITGKENISRWETFKELAKGIGFNFEMYLNPGTEVSSQPEFILNIFFIDDLADNEAVTFTEVVEHKEFTTEARLEYLFFKYRNIVFNEGEYDQGILFNSSQFWDTDTDQAANQLHPSFFNYLDGKVLSLTNASGGNVKTVIKDVDYKELELKQYNYDFNPGIGIGKLYPINEANGGGMSFAKIFNCATGSGTNIDLYNHKPIQQYAINNYKRYLKGLQKAKELIVKFDHTTRIKTWNTFILNEGFGEEKYYISAIREIKLDTREASIEGIKLIQ